MKTDKPMPTATSPDVRYAMDSVRAIEGIKDQLGTILRSLATKRALEEGRDLVTADDVARSVPEALQESLEHLYPEETEHTRRGK